MNKEEARILAEKRLDYEEMQKMNQDWMHVLLTDLRTENEQLRAIVKEVATGDTTYYDGYGDRRCVFCQGEEDWMEGAYQHEPTCIVTLARAIMQKWEAK